MPSAVAPPSGSGVTSDLGCRDDFLGIFGLHSCCGLQDPEYLVLAERRPLSCGESFLVEPASDTPGRFPCRLKRLDEVDHALLRYIWDELTINGPESVRTLSSGLFAVRPLLR